ncbi:hypothetical protein HGB07_09470, partial [Candidatus Roizmanbacteria bacterium]|nr:hypothetical protein [Candidatus Roizmanbacteria bacterium]
METQIPSITKNDIPEMSSLLEEDRAKMKDAFDDLISRGYQKWPEDI